MIVINLFAGPGSGKSTLASELFVVLKKKGLNVEYVTEYAKDLTYESRMDRIVDYLYVLAEQHHRLSRLEGKVDIAICDGPFLLGAVHFKKNRRYKRKVFNNLILDMFNSYENINYYISRDGIEYQNSGRRESLEEAKEIDLKIVNLLDKKNIKFKKLYKHNCIDIILKDIKKRVLKVTI